MRATALLVLVPLLGCQSSWQAAPATLTAEIRASRTEVARVGSGERVVAVDDGWRLEATPVCRERRDDDTSWVRSQRSEATQWANPWLVAGIAVVPVVGLATFGGAVLLFGKEEEPTPGPSAGEWLLGWTVLGALPAAAALPFIVFGDVVVEERVGQGHVVTWTSEAAPCDDGAWRGTADRPIALTAPLATRDGEVTLRRVVRSGADGAVPADAVAAFAGLADWCGALELTATPAEAHTSSEASISLAPRAPPLALPALSALDADVGFTARQCCERDAAAAAAATCAASCVDAADVGARLACEGACRVDALARACP